MKYLKLFEGRENAKYKVGDIVLVNSTYNYILNSAMKIVFINYPDQTSYDMIFVDDPDATDDMEYMILETDVVRKLEDWEIEALKYNL